MNKNYKYILVVLGGILAMEFLASCQEQGSTANTPAQPTTTKSTQIRTSQGSMQRTRTVTASPTP
jgi:hypothetical protein